MTDSRKRFNSAVGTPCRRAVEEGLLDPKRTVQIGIRGSIYSPDDMSFAESSGMRVIYMEEFSKLGPAKVTLTGGWMRERDEGTGWYATGNIDFSF